METTYIYIYIAIYRCIVGTTNSKIIHISKIQIMCGILLRHFVKLFPQKYYSGEKKQFSRRRDMHISFITLLRSSRSSHYYHIMVIITNFTTNLRIG